MTIDDIKTIQRIVGANPDGIMGPKTIAAIKIYQSSHGLVPDGIVGPKTFEIMNNSLNSSNSNPVNKFEENYNTVGDTQTSTYSYQQNLKNEGLSETTVKNDLKIAGDSGMINPNFINTLLADPSIIAYYANAMTYGNYKVGDMINDAKRRELISQGNTQLEDLQIINPEVTKEQYLSTTEGLQSRTDTAKSIPTFDFQGLLDDNILQWGSDMPPELFDNLTPQMDPNSPEFKQAVEDVKATYFDLASASMGADTAQAKAVADANLKEFTKQLNEKYGITLSDNADKAWSQIESLADTYSKGNLSGSGMEAQAIDESLQNSRKIDQRQRLAKLDAQQQQELTVLLASGKPEEIAAMITKLDAEDAKNGVDPKDYRSKIFKVPSDIVAKYSLDSLRNQYPNKTDKEIQAIHDAMMDDNGNYRSGIYKKYYEGLATQEITNQTAAESQVKLDNQNKNIRDTTNAIGDTTGADPLKPIIPHVPTDPNNGNVPITLDANGKKPDDSSYQFNTQTGKPNPNYINPTTGKAGNDTSNQYNTNTGVLNTNYKAPTAYNPAPITPATPIKTPTPINIPTQPTPKTGYQGVSVVDYLSSVGKDSSYANRKKLYGGTTYSGSPTENTELLKRLRGY